MDGIPEDFAFQLLQEDWDQFEILMKGALHRTPVLETAEIRQLLNGPESFTPDGNFILGEAPELGGFFVAAGFNSAGIANAGGAGRLIAEWIVGGEPSSDLWDVDIRRFGAIHANREFLRDRTVESLGLHYAMRWPRQELVSGRPLRRSPLYDRLAAKGARFGSKMGWERANYFAPPEIGPLALGFGKPAWLPFVAEEQKAAREAAVVIDQSSFGKLLVQGRDALALLQQLCANEMDVAPGRITYTAMLNRRGGFESDLTVIRLGEAEFLLITGSAQPTRDADWIRRHVGDRFVTLFDATGAWSVISVIGPEAAALVPLPPHGETREIDLGLGRARVARMSYAGGPAAELYVPTEMAATVYDHLAGKGVRDAGYYALDGLRIEAGRRAFAAELGPGETPIEAGLMQGVKLDKAAPFLGRDALLRLCDVVPKKRLALFRLDAPDAFPWGGEVILRDGAPVGELTSAGWSHRLGRALAMGYVRGDAVTPEWLLAGRYEIDLAGTRLPATALSRPVFPYRG
jgi:4-methylaminobutanoate oxidase (formaldehyde-forming)